MEIQGGRCRGTKRGVRDRHDLMVLPGTQARRGHTNDLPPLSVSVKPEDLSNEGAVMRPPPITDCQRVRVRNPVEKWRIRAQTTSRTQFIDKGLPQSLWGGLRGNGRRGDRKSRPTAPLSPKMRTLTSAAPPPAAAAPGRPRSPERRWRRHHKRGATWTTVNLPTLCVRPVGER